MNNSQTYQVRWGKFVCAEVEQRYLRSRIDAVKQSLTYLYAVLGCAWLVAISLDLARLSAAHLTLVLGIRALVVFVLVATLASLQRWNKWVSAELSYNLAVSIALLGYGAIAATYLQSTGRSDYATVLGSVGALVIALNPLVGKGALISFLVCVASFAWIQRVAWSLGQDVHWATVSVLVPLSGSMAANLVLHTRSRHAFAGAERLNRSEAELRRITETDAHASRLALQRKNDEWKAVVENGQLLVIQLDRPGLVTFANERATAAGVVVGESLVAWLGTGGSSSKRNPFESVYVVGRSSDLEASVVRGQELLTFALRAAPVGHSLPHDAISVMGLDITESRKTSNELLQSQKQQVVGALVGGVTHDFNNLLTVITGSAELLLEDDISAEERREYVEDVLEASFTAANLTRQLLLFSRRQPARAVSIELNALIQNLFHLLSRMIGKKVKLQLCLEKSDLWVNADPSHVEQLLMNLVVNARDAMPTGGTIRLQSLAADGGVELVVADNGCGMSSDVSSHVFEPFYSTKGKTQGTGLGLTTVKNIVEQLSGTIELSSAEGEGTTFRIWVPRAAPAGSSHIVPKRSVHSLRRVLIVDDDEAILTTAGAMLRRDNYEVILASNAERAVALAQRRHDLDLLLADVHLPVTGGPGLALAVEKEVPNIGVVYMSGYVDDPVFLKKVEEGARVLLDKPFTSRDLLGTLDEAFVARKSGG